MKNKRLFQEALAAAERIYVVKLDDGDDNWIKERKVEEQTGFKNLLAGSIVGGLVHVGWRAANIDGVKTLIIRHGEKAADSVPAASLKRQASEMLVRAIDSEDVFSGIDKVLSWLK